MTDTPRTDEAPLLELMGVKPDFLPDEEAPPVDETRIEQLLSGKLTGCDLLEVEFAVRSYSPWYRAWSQAIARRARAAGR
jgi:hypothetical protein